MAKKDDRTRSMSFSSEGAEVPRWFGKEVLDHSPGAVRSDFLNSGRAPLLLNHDSSAQPIGVIEKGSVKIGNDKVGRCDARFGKTGAASDALTNVDDKILNNTSVGYRVHEMRFDSEKEGDEVYKVTDWEPYEVSMVGVPADRSVGIDRAGDVSTSITQGVRSMGADGGTSAAADGAANKGPGAAGGGTGGDATRVEVTRHEEQQRNAVQLEAARKRTIETLCSMNGIDDRIRDQWITSGAPIETYERDGRKIIGVADEMLSIMKSRGESSPRSASALGLSENEAQRFSICKAILAIRDKDWGKAGFEAECSRSIAQKLGKAVDPNKFYVPLEVQRSRRISPEALDLHSRSGMNGARGNPLASVQNSHLTRADVVGTSSAGGYLVETINLSFIELLRNRTVAFRLGATVLSGLVGNVNIPKQTGASTAMWLSTETTQITEVEQTFGQLALSPHTIGGYTEISRLLLLQSSPDVEGIVNADLAAIIGIAVDAGVISGAGSGGAPHGIVGLTGVGTGSIASTVLSTLLTIQGTVGAANVVPVRGGWAGTFTVSAGLRGRNEFANTYSPIWYGSVWDGMMLGYPAMASNQVPSGDLIFGDWAQVVVAEWGVLEVEVNPYANFQAGIIGVRALMTIDVGVRYPAAFYVGTSFS
jgi:HK97 family phage major capsid protein/HK97 family phage prohead protease